MKASSISRVALALLIAIELSVIVQSQGRGGGAGAGQRGQPPARGGPPRDSASRGDGAGRGDGRGRGERRGQDIELDNGLVTAYVTVTNSERRGVPGLTRSNFRVLEDGMMQQIKAFSAESGPTTVGFIVGGDPSEFRGIAPAFLKATPWDDEYFVLVDTGQPPGGTVIQNFTTDILKVPKNFLPGGVTPDSIYVGLDNLKEAANRRKLLLLFGGSLNTDGSPANGLDPNYVVRMATKERVQVYSILTSNDGGATFDDAGTSDIAPLTGGRSYVANAASGTLESIAEEIARGLVVQYLIGYHTTNPEKDGKWRSLKVELVNTPGELGKLKVWTRSGYYVEKEKKPGK